MVDRKLGRGLDFFLSGSRSTTPAPAGAGAPAAAAAGTPAGDQTLMLDVSQLTPNPYQPRAEIDPAELESLAASIKTSGILQPILARRVGERFQIVAGERRWRAATQAGLVKVPVWVKSITDEESAVFGLVENLQREDLNAIEKATAMRSLLEKLKCSQEDLGKRVGLDRSSVANLIRLLDLPEPVQAHVSRGTLTMGHARALLALPDAETRVKVAEDAIRRGLSVRQVEELVREVTAPPAGKPQAAGGEKNRKGRPVWLNELEETLVETLGTPVSIRYGKKRSQIVIECAGREQFERLYERLKNL